MTDGNKATLEKSLNQLIDQALLCVEELQKDPSVASSGTEGTYDEEFLRKELVNASKVLSHNATKLSLTAPSYSRDCPATVSEMSKCLLHTLAVVCSIPSSGGKTLSSLLRSTVSTLAIDVATLANNFLSSPRDLNKIKGAGYLPSTGLVWKACEAVESLPMNNGGAVAEKVKANLRMVEDAILEVEEGLEAGDDADDGGWDDLLDDDECGGAGEMSWTESEKEYVRKCLIIIKATRLAMKKAIKGLEAGNAPLSGENLIGSQDELARLCEACSREVDDLASTLADAPIPMRPASDMASALVRSATEFLQVAKSLSEPASAAWFGMCISQIEKVLEQLLEKEPSR
ncbi:Cyclin-D1-binding protein 1 [Borealophlyctis nickersoniae]|nr:Cyclin-D1-binding protein 1 [Borealophlyctis nickersoniae]